MSIANGLPWNSKILKDAKILVVDNDRDSRDLYVALLEGYGAQITTAGSIKDALDLLNRYTPNILICEMRFLGESVAPLIQQIKHLELNNGSSIPVLVISTCSLRNLAQQLKFKFESYLIKPIDIDYFVYEVWHLTYISEIIQSLNTQRQSAAQDRETALCGQTRVA